METSITIQGRATRAARRQARRPHSAARRTATQARSLRARVATAFRELAHGVPGKAAWTSTIAFYRSGGQPWTSQLG
ncbi:MAG TPA: hypothetical protein VFP62_06470 [Burkholderiales bacterium]|jgi:hypothetical protein|nr:hypothetical protein [Burkholderiales bacterium]